MRRFRWIALALTASLAWGCISDAGAEDVPTPTATSAVSPTPQFITPTPKPQFGPPTVSPASLTATAAALSPTLMPTPGAEATASASPSPTATSTPPPFVFFSPPQPGSFEPVLEYEYTVPEGWTASTGDEEITAVHSDGLLKVTLREIKISRDDYLNFAAVTQALEPSRPAGWSAWSQSRSNPVDGGGKYEYLYTGVRYGHDFVSLIQWQLWGERLIEVAIEADADTWANDSKLRNESLLIMSTFDPVETGPLSSVDSLRQLLKARFGFFRSGIYVMDNQGYRQELSCRNVFLELLTDPVYVGGGAWQVHATGDLGAQVWMIYEPTGTIVPVSTNTSKC